MIQIAYSLILSNDNGETFILVPEHSEETKLIAAKAIASHVGGDLEDAPKAAVWLASTAKAITLRRHTKDPDGECFCEDGSWWCPDADGETGSFYRFRFTDIETAEMRGIGEQAGEEDS